MNALTRSGRWAALLLLTLGWITPAQAMDSEPFYKSSFLDLAADLQEATQANHLLMILFEQEGCPYCSLMHQVHFRDRNLVKALTEHFDVVQLDIWGGRELTGLDGVSRTEKAQARAWGAQFSPFMLVFDGAGREIFRMPGYMKPRLFKAAVEFLAHKHYETTDFRTYAQQHAEPETQPGLAASTLFASEPDLSALASRARAEHKGVALLFEHPLCADCQELHKASLSRPEVIKTLSDAFAPARIDLGSSNQVTDLDGVAKKTSAIADRFNVRFSPTLVFLDESGQELTRYDGYLQPEHFTNFVHYAASGESTKHASYQDWIRERKRPKP